jgi:PEP-CTERM putative exosortase interaction domain
MSKAALLLAAGALIVLPAAPAQASTTVYSATLSAASEVPPVPSPGTGTVTLTVDDVALSVQVQTSFSGLTSNDTAALFHCCGGAGTNSPVATASPAFAAFPLSVTSGTFNSMFSLTDSAFYNPTFITNNGGTASSAAATFLAALAAGNVYFNIHTSNFPGGEIRGQLAPVTPGVPEPATWVMMLLGFGCAGLKVRCDRSSLAPPLV